MGDLKMTFAISILDKRNDEPTLHAANFILNENVGIWACFMTINDDEKVDDYLNGSFPDLEERSVVDLLNGNDGNWADLMKQGVEDTVRNIFHKLIRENMNEDPDGLLQRDLSIWWKENDQRARMPGVLAGTSLGDLIEKLTLNHNGQNEMFFYSVLVLK